MGTLGGLNLNLVSSLKLNLSFRVGRVGTLGGGLGWGPEGEGRVGDPGGEFEFGFKFKIEIEIEIEFHNW